MTTKPLPRKKINKLFKEYKFKNYVLALEFATQVANLAEQENHHPLIALEWGRVRVWWWTHAIEGLHKNDFVCAAKQMNFKWIKF
ncbi:MAG: hypothetical protein CM15mP12_3920 [Gammaproteobacteria bacterium]|nr:MAG: hypothetical protein CM15mP12_3920 [Gammaproteobacteria bacterium]